MDKNQQEKSKFPDTEEAQYEQDREQYQPQPSPVANPRLDPYPAEERDLDEEAHRQMEEGR
jgi:hypothetical protein